MVTDTWRGRVVVFGGSEVGQGGNTANQETWEWDGHAWLARRPTNPPPVRWRSAMAFDTLRGRTVLFGGFGTAQSPLLGDTWEWDGVNWTLVSAAQGPSARQLMSMAFDAARGKVVMFGGFDSNSRRNDTWEFDGQQWTQAQPPVSPPARVGASMAFDPVRNRIVLFGGEGVSGLLSDNWEWDGSVWVQFPVGSFPNGPLPRFTAGMAYDVTRSRLVLVGGRNSSRALDDTWERNGTTWSLRSSSAIARRAAVAAAWDPVRGAVILYGGFGVEGYASDVLSWNGVAWSPVTSDVAPGVRTQGPPVLARDPTGGIILYGGAGYGAVGSQGSFGSFDFPPDVWRWGGSTWARIVATNPNPGIRDKHTMAYDLARNRVVLFGGDHNYIPMNDTWLWDGASWTNAATTGPSPRIASAMAWHAPTSRIVLFGGEPTGGPALGDTWEWDGILWTQRNPANAPPARHSHGMAGDVHRGVVVLFGGYTSHTLGDTWEWDGNDWILRAAVTPGLEANWLGMAYDEARRRVVMAGGFNGLIQAWNGAWEWDGTTWTQRTPAAAFELNRKFVYDPNRRRIVGFNGFTREYGPVSPAAVAVVGTACSTSIFTPIIRAHDGLLPWLGDTLPIEADPSAPNDFVAFALGTTRTLPISLAPLAMPGCDLNVSPEVLVLIQASSSIATLPISIPNQPSLLGSHVFVQGFPFTPGANPLGLLATQGLHLILGGR